jgi:predicted DNA-binding antitoxin AbrB/MazE fold protein
MAHSTEEEKDVFRPLQRIAGRGGEIEVAIRTSKKVVFQLRLG